jgi:Fe-S-cluster containining protein
MECRPGCAACCIALSISSPLPGMPHGKPAGTACVNLEPKELRCRIWGQDSYPAVCRRFMPEPETCGGSREEAMSLIGELEKATNS